MKELHIFPTVKAAHSAGFGGARLLYNNDPDRRAWIPPVTGIEWVKGQRFDKVFVHLGGATALTGRSLDALHRGIEEARFSLHPDAKSDVVVV